MSEKQQVFLKVTDTEFALLLAGLDTMKRLIFQGRNLDTIEKSVDDLRKMLIKQVLVSESSDFDSIEFLDEYNSIEMMITSLSSY